MSRVYIRGYAQRAEGDTGSGPLRFVAATEGVKRDGIDLRMSAVDLSRFELNPVFGYGHCYWGRDSLPIGRATNVHVDGPRLLADVEFDQDDEFAVAVERKYRGGFLNAVSIGFDYDQFVLGPGGDGHDASVVPVSWQLMEISSVPLPMDPEAIVDSGRAQADALARALAGVREGKVLSKANAALVQDAVDALSALLTAATGEDPPRQAPPAGQRDALAARQRRLRLAEAAAL